ncbi:Imm50 family immunity protein [Streptomyces rimosus]|uniref:Imm50 family immunity protein n=1 Tax=Streptomyces rimosus TaxID=1927 RepID=UPI00099BD76C|nr:Imm50 family immunity protein [Streptomyces rimosus]
MIQNWADLIHNGDKLGEFFTSIPPLEQVLLRSVHFSRFGPTVILRLDLPRFPDRPLPEWVERGCDRLQCHVRFLAVDNVSMRRWEPPVVADVQLTPLERRRIKVRVASDQTSLEFTSSDSLTVGRVSAFRSPGCGPDRVRHYYAGKMDSRKYECVPNAEAATYYEQF